MGGGGFYKRPRTYQLNNYTQETVNPSIIIFYAMGAKGQKGGVTRRCIGGVFITTDQED